MAAKNYSFKEAVEIITVGTDTEAINEIGRKHPLMAVAITRVAAQAGMDLLYLTNHLPDNLSAQKVNQSFKTLLTEVDEKEVEVVAEPVKKEAPGRKVTKAKAAPKAAKKEVEPKSTKAVEDEVSEDSFETMTGGAIYNLLKEHGKVGEAKTKNKAGYIEAAIRLWGTPSNVEPQIPQEEPVKEAKAKQATTNEVEENKYEGITAPELYKEVKTRGIKAPARKKAQFYIDLLVEDDKAKAATEVEVDEDWTAEVEDVEEVVKETVEDILEDEDDEDWDL